MPIAKLTYRATRRFSPLVCDYAEHDPFLRSLYTFPFTREGLDVAAAQRAFDPERRSVLCAALERQYAGVPVAPEVRDSLDRLHGDHCLTITTGHQLCLFTGPLYVPIKIMNAVRLARDLSTDQRPVVPVFWMASEDHDRTEVDHAFVFNHKLRWPGESGGPVGRERLKGIEAVLAELDGLLGTGANADELRAAIQAAYRPEHTLAQATRLLVNALYGRYGVVVIDGDDADLKRLFVPAMRRELTEGLAAACVQQANAVLEQRYEPQAHARPINLFHLGGRSRLRIERNGDRYLVHGSGVEFDTDGILSELAERPQDFSPNVLLRPLYQETVLPNIAYVGGGGELAYWLQLKPLFEVLDVPMPVLALRTSALFLGSRERERLAELGLDPADMFSPIDLLKERVALRGSAIDTSMETELRDQQGFFDRLAARVKAVDPTLEAAVRGEAQRAAKALDHVGQKLLRAAKRDQEQALQRLDRLHAWLFPDGGLMERRDNFIPIHLREGHGLFDRLRDELDPIGTLFSVLEA